MTGLNSFTLHRQFSNGQKAVALDLHQSETQTHIVRGVLGEAGGYTDNSVQATADGMTVFTPDFSGCSLYVDQRNANTYRVYHVESGKEQAQDESQNHYLGAAAKWTSQDHAKEGSPRAFALMRYHDGQWWMQFKSRPGRGA